MHDFDRPLARDERTCLKRREGRGAEIALGVADMDFPPPPAVLAALEGWVAAGDIGYALPDPALKQVIADWCAERYGWTVETSWLALVPGVVTGLAMFCRLLERPGHLVTPTPIYPPFFSVGAAGGRELRGVPMLDTDQGWRLDWPALEAACEGAAALLLCQPHNPTGRVFDDAELARFAELAERFDLAVCSDEIWSDLIIDPQARHRPFAAVDEGAAARSLTLMAPSKTFNVAGLFCSFAVCPDPGLRRRLLAFQQTWALYPNAAGTRAALAAYGDGGPWLDDCLTYLRGNIDLIERTAKQLGLGMHAPEATYVCWLRCGDEPDAGSRLVAACREQGLALRSGEAFGDDRYLRLNAASPRAVIIDALARLRRAVEGRRA